MTDEERQARIGELVRTRTLVADLLKAIDERLEALGYAELQDVTLSPVTASVLWDTYNNLRAAYIRFAELVAASEDWAEWISYVLQNLDRRAEEDAFRTFLESLQASISTRLEEGRL